MITFATFKDWINHLPQETYVLDVVDLENCYRIRQIDVRFHVQDEKVIALHNSDRIIFYQNGEKLYVQYLTSENHVTYDMELGKIEMFQQYKRSLSYSFPEEE